MTPPEPGYGFPAVLWRTLDRARPPLPRFRSALRGPRLTAWLGLVLLVGMPVVIVTGLLSYVAYGSAPIPADVGPLRLPAFDWPTSPSWLYRVNQGTHVLLGLVLVPVVLAKLWSVVPKLFAWPPARSLTDALERITVLLLVGSLLFEIVTGVLNIQYDYVFGFSFYAAHYTGAWVFIGAFVSHAVLKVPHMVTALRRRAEPPDHDLVADDPLPPTITRRGALTLVGSGAALVGALSVGQVLDGPLRGTALLLPRGRTTAGADGGPNDFPVNRTFAVTGIAAAATGAAWRLDVTGARTLRLDRDALLGMALHTADLPISCVEGWSTQQTWTGVRLRDLAALAGVPAPASAVVRSLEEGPFAQAELHAGQAVHPDALLALRVNGADLSPDHGFPARLIVPAIPGVRCTKWVRSVEFRSA